MPSIVMSGLLPRRLLSLSVVAEVGAQRIGDQCREGGARLDGVMLDLLDQGGPADGGADAPAASSCVDLDWSTGL
jgi:hypothetical protein